MVGNAWQRRLSFLSEFNCEIRHLPGSKNVVADALSLPDFEHDPQSLSVSDPITPDSEHSLQPLSVSGPTRSGSGHDFQPNSISDSTQVFPVAVSVKSPLPPQPVPEISFTEMVRLQQICPKVEDLCLSSAVNIVSVLRSPL